MPALASAALTEVELYWTRGKCEHWLRFGKPVSTHTTQPGRRIECYAPGQIFALVRWASNHHGSVLSQLDVLQAVGKHTPITRMADVAPGAQVLLSVRSWRQVRRVFTLIEAIEALGIDPCDLQAVFWNDIHTLLAPARPPDMHATGSGRASLAQKAHRP